MHISANKISHKTAITAANMNFWITPNRNSNLDNAWSCSSFSAHPGYLGNVCFSGLSLAHQSMTQMHWEWTKAFSCNQRAWRRACKSRDPTRFILPDAATNIYQHYFSPLAPFLILQPVCSEEGGGRESRGNRWPAALGIFCTFNNG